MPSFQMNKSLITNELQTNILAIKEMHSNLQLTMVLDIQLENKWNATM